MRVPAPLSAALLIASLLAVTLGPVSPAFAGRRAYTFTWDTETVNKGDIEIEQWLWSRALQPGAHLTSGWIWFAPVYGLTNHVELAIPWEVVVTPKGTQLADFTLEGRFRLYDPEKEDQFVRVLLRAAYTQNFANPDNAGLPPTTGWAALNAVVSLGDTKGTHGTIDVGGLADLHFGAKKLVRQTLGAGMTFKVSDEWRLGAEYYHQLQFGGAITATFAGHDAHQFFAGPNVGFSRGRVWMTIGALIGLNEAAPRVMPRFMLAVAI